MNMQTREIAIDKLIDWVERGLKGCIFEWLGHFIFLNIGCDMNSQCIVELFSMKMSNA